MSKVVLAKPLIQPSKSVSKKLFETKLKKTSSTSLNLKIQPFNSTNSMKLDPSISVGGAGSDVYSMEIYSNWGDEQKLSLSAIWFLDENRLPIEPIKTRSIPENKEENLKKLTERILLKTDPSTIWSCQWPDELYDVFTIYFCLPKNRKPKFARLWNASFAGNSSAKDVAIFLGKEAIFKGEIPRCYGQDVQLFLPEIIEETSSTLLMSQIFGPAVIDPDLVTDKYGVWPLIQTKIIKILFHTNYGDEKLVGLNAIDIFDDNYVPVEWDQIEDVTIKNAVSFTDPLLLFKAQKETIIEEDMFMIEAKWKEEKPSLNIIFKKPIIISQLVFWNFNCPYKGLTIGANHCSIICNKNLLWNGKVRQAYGVTTAVGHSTTSVWLTDLPELRKKEYISNHMNQN